MVIIYENKDIEAKSETQPQQPPDSRTEKVNVEDEVFSPLIKPFLTNFENQLTYEKTPESTVKVSEVFGGLARLYERVRTTVEYKGDPVLRRNAIERILKRLVWEKEGQNGTPNSRKISESLIRELIWARYLPNNSVPKRKIESVGYTLDKYFYLLNNIEPTVDIQIVKIRSLIWGVASAEAEEILDPSEREIYVQLMYDWFTKYFDWQDAGIEDHEKQIQVYLAVHRALPKSDDPTLVFHLLLKEFPNWQNMGKNELDNFIKDFPNVYREIERHLNFYARLNLFRRVQRQAAAFEIFKEISKNKKADLRKLLMDKGILEEEIKKVCDKNYRQAKGKIARGIVRSIIYIFLTKVAIAFFLEIPYEVYRFGDVRLLPLMINIVFPPFMMFLIGMSIRIPDSKNTQKIIERIKSVVYNEEEFPRQVISIKGEHGLSLASRLFTLFYTILTVLVFLAISYILIKIKFTFFGIALFFGFLSLVLLFAFRIRFNANQLKVEGNQEGILSHLFDYLTLPLLNLGFLLSRGLSKLNFLTVILDFLIEAPLKSILEIFEEWTSFLREKKEEVVEIPE